ncbi:MAG TPA: AI-2E family transporter, partial [Paludibacter sp.]|nr:AI-2E family transporter [Paludibacter sp.]
WPKLVERFTVLANQFVSWLSETLNIKTDKMYGWIKRMQSEIINTGSVAIGKTLLGVGTALALVLLVPVYVFVILYYKPLLLEFIRRLFSNNDTLEMDLIVRETETIIQYYLVGILIEVVIMAVLEATALLVMGIEYAVLLGIIGALLNMIPYVGGLVGVVIPMMVALATKESAWYAVYIMVVFYLIQLFDNNYIVPIIVASKVKINALFSIIVVLVGNSLWGIPGMFLSIPMLAIVKVVFDHIESLNPWGYLFGDTMPEPFNAKRKRQKKPRKKGV